jgi:hypothetical protein
MTLEIVEEKSYTDGTWYSLKVDGTSKQYSRKLEEIEKLYQEIKDNPEILNTEKNVLKSEEIIVDLQEKN